MNKLEQIREYMNRNDIDGVLLISPENVRWLSGFSGDSAQILVTQNHQYFITDCRYIEQAEREMGDTFRYIKAAHAERLRRIDKLLDKHGTKCLGIEKEVVTISLMQKYQESWFMKSLSGFGVSKRPRSWRACARGQRSPRRRLSIF